MSKRNRKKIERQRYVRHSKGGKFERKVITMRELLELGINLQEHPAQPWSKEETHRRFEDSDIHGHLQLWFKCQNCGLEYIIPTLRSYLEAIEQYQPSHGVCGGLAARVTCPECGKTGMSFLYGGRHQEGTIYQATASRFRVPLDDLEIKEGDHGE